MGDWDSRQQEPPPRADEPSTPAQQEPGVRRAESAAAAPTIDPYDTPDVVLDEPGYGHGV